MLYHLACHREGSVRKQEARRVRQSQGQALIALGWRAQEGALPLKILYEQGVVGALWPTLSRPPALGSEGNTMKPSSEGIEVKQGNQNSEHPSWFNWADNLPACLLPQASDLGTA
jgi:hypothetical protein